MLVKKLLQLFLTPLPSCMKVPIYRMLGAKIASGATIAPMTVCVADQIEMGPRAKIKPLSIIYSPCRLELGGLFGGRQSFRLFTAPARSDLDRVHIFPPAA